MEGKPKAGKRGQERAIDACVIYGTLPFCMIYTILITHTISLFTQSLLQRLSQKRSFQPSHFSSKGLHLTPAIEWPPIIRLQTTHHIIPRLLHSPIIFLQLPLAELLFQHINLFLHTCPAQVPQLIRLRLRLMVCTTQRGRLVRDMRLRSRICGFGSLVGCRGDFGFKVV